MSSVSDVCSSADAVVSSANHLLQWKKSDLSIYQHQQRIHFLNSKDCKTVDMSERCYLERALSVVIMDWIDRAAWTSATLPVTTKKKTKTTM